MDTDFAFASIAEFAQKMEREFPLHVAALKGLGHAILGNFV